MGINRNNQFLNDSNRRKFEAKYLVELEEGDTAYLVHCSCGCGMMRVEYDRDRAIGWFVDRKEYPIHIMEIKVTKSLFRGPVESDETGDVTE